MDAKSAKSGRKIGRKEMISRLLCEKCLDNGTSEARKGTRTSWIDKMRLISPWHIRTKTLRIQVSAGPRPERRPVRVWGAMPPTEFVIVMQVTFVSSASKDASQVSLETRAKCGMKFVTYHKGRGLGKMILKARDWAHR